MKKTHKKTHIIAITNQKGGEGKTTTAINLAFGLAKEKKNVLLIDLDPQANTTGIFLKPDTLEKNITQLLQRKISCKDSIYKTKETQLHLIPTNISLAELESLAANIEAPYLLRDSLEVLLEEEAYDYIVMDCPPSLSIFTINALVAATHVIIPVQAEKFSVDGMQGLQKTINSIKRRINPQLEIIGALLTQVKPKTVLNKTIYPVISQFFHVFKTNISSGVTVGESHLARQSIFDYAPQSKQSKEYLSFVKEVIDELKN